MVKQKKRKIYGTNNVLNFEVKKLLKFGYFDWLYKKPEIKKNTGTLKKVV
jgi:hypothetical protein